MFFDAKKHQFWSARDVFAQSSRARARAQRAKPRGSLSFELKRGRAGRARLGKRCARQKNVFPNEKNILFCCATKNRCFLYGNKKFSFEENEIYIVKLPLTGVPLCEAKLSMVFPWKNR